MRKMIIVGLLLSLTTLYANEVKQKISLYGWLPTLDGTLKFKIPNDPNDKVNVSVIDSLDAVFMGAYEVRKEKWSFSADFIYLKMSGETQVLNSKVTLDMELKAKLFGFYGGYNLVQTDKTDLNFIVGMRYFGLDIDASLNGGIMDMVNGIKLSPSIESYDAVFGFKGEYTINEHWYLPYQFDIGTGDSDLTWQANASIAYRFGWGDVVATYRYIHYDKKDSTLINDFDLQGPKLGVVFHF